jgi:hypothetical protein
MSNYIQNLLSKPLYTMTGEEFLALQKVSLENIVNNDNPTNEYTDLPEFVKGISGIMKTFHVCRSKAIELKNGIIKDAVQQDKRTIIVDVKLAKKLFKKYSDINKRKFLKK